MVSRPVDHTAFTGVNCLRLPRACFLSEHELLFDNMYGSVRRAVHVDLERKEAQTVQGLAAALLATQGGPCTAEKGAGWCPASDASVTVLDVSPADPERSIPCRLLYAAAAPNAPARIGVAALDGAAVDVTCGPPSGACGVSAKVPMGGRTALGQCREGIEAMRWQVIRRESGGLPIEG